MRALAGILAFLVVVMVALIILAGEWIKTRKRENANTSSNQIHKENNVL